jgi:hypothetical protein
MTIKQADNDLKKQLMNGDKTPDQVNNETNHSFNKGNDGFKQTKKIKLHF